MSQSPETQSDETQSDETQSEQTQPDEAQPETPQSETPQAEGSPAETQESATPEPALQEAGTEQAEAHEAGTEEAGAEQEASTPEAGTYPAGDYPPESSESHDAAHAAGSAAPDGTESAQADQPAASKKKKKKKNKDANQPTPAQVVKRVGTTNEQALTYIAKPDPQLSRLPKKVYEALLPELPPVTAGALLGPAALTRHFIASAAAGRYRDLFFLWDVFRAHPDAAKPEISARSEALEKGQHKLETATRVGLVGHHPDLVAQDIARAEGLIWQWLRAVLVEKPELTGRRPAIASALLTREPDLDVQLPSHPDETWLIEAAGARVAGDLAPPVDQLLSANAHRLPATLETLRLATRHYPDRVAALIDRVDLDSPDIGAFLAWARDHQASDRLHGRIREQVSGAAARDLAEGLSRWHHWVARGVSLELPSQLRQAEIDQFDLTKPETAALTKKLIDGGAEVDLQSRLQQIAAANMQRGEKAYEAMVCEDLPVSLPDTLEGNPAVKEGTRCPKCRAWTWVRPGHEQRCPRPEPAADPEPTLNAFELAAAEAAQSADNA